MAQAEELITPAMSIIVPLRSGSGLVGGVDPATFVCGSPKAGHVLQDMTEASCG
jgi:hypothetical protein